MTVGRLRLAAIAVAASSAVVGTQDVRHAALAASGVVEQTGHGHRDHLPLVAAFDGLGADLHAGPTPPRNPSDNSLAVGPDHIVQTVNSQVAIFTKVGDYLKVGATSYSTRIGGVQVPGCAR